MTKSEKLKESKIITTHKFGNCIHQINYSSNPK